MSRSITIGGVERADLTRLESFSFQETAYRGEVGQGGFDVDTEALAVDVAAWKDVEADDSDGGRIFTGQTIDRGLGRGPYTTDADAQWDVQVVDINTVMDDILLRTSEWNRPEETDVARMQDLVAYMVAQGYAIGDDYLSTSDPETLDAYDYRKTGSYPRTVADTCAEQSDKNWFLKYDQATAQVQLHYYKTSAAVYTSDGRISSVLADIDDYGVTWAAEWPEESGLQRDPSRVYSAVQVIYGTTPSQVYVDRPATEAAFKRRETSLFDDSVTGATSATRLANYFLDNAETEDDTITVAVTLPTTFATLFQAGHRIECKFPHLGYAAFTWMRCIRWTIEPAGEESKAPDRYRVILVLKPKPKVTRFGGRGDQPEEPPADEVTPTEPAEMDTGACVGLGPRTTMNRYRSNQTAWVEQNVEGGGLILAYAGSWVYQNIAWAAAGCPLGGGGWEGYYDRESWFPFTAPADDPSYLGLMVTVDATGAWSSGYVGGYHVAIADGVAASGRFGDHTAIAAGITGGVITAYVPRSHVNWGGSNSIVLAPDWECARSFFTCNGLGSFSFPYQDGRGGSGLYAEILPQQACAVFWASGTTGPTDHGVAGYGAVDGVNRTFTLIGWDGTGTPTLSVNGLDQTNLDATFNRSTGSVTLAGPPPAGAVLLWTYMVGTLGADVTLAPEPVAIIVAIPEALVTPPTVLLPDPVPVGVAVPDPTVGP